MKHPLTITEFFEKVGRKRFEDAMSIPTQLATRAIKDGVMPAHWFRDVRDWCVANQIDVPEHLFRWRNHANSKQNDYRKRQVQDQVENNIGAT